MNPAKKPKRRNNFSRREQHSGSLDSKAKAVSFMATQTHTLPATGITAPRNSGLMLPAFSLWQREVVRFYRQRSRVVGVIASPVLFWLVIGAGFGSSFRSTGTAGGQHYLDYFFPGALIMIVLFTAIFTMMSVIEDRKEGFLLSVLVAPVSRSVIVLGKVLGGATLATAQGMVFLLFAPALGVHFSVLSFVLTVLVIFLVAFSLTALGFIIAWPMDSTAGFHAVINLFLIPLWLLSGSMFPLAGASFLIRMLMRINPLTYGTEALRSLLFPGSVTTDLSLGGNFAVLALFTLVMFALSFVVANRRSTKPAA
jgi:ABC-2 type transport system permease protein